VSENASINVCKNVKCYNFDFLTVSKTNITRNPVLGLDFLEFPPTTNNQDYLPSIPVVMCLYKRNHDDHV